MNIRFLFLAFLLLAENGTFAHEDPSGDIHPFVRVENGNFAIYFQNNQARREIDEESAVFRVVYSPEGALLAPRHPAGAAQQSEMRAAHGGVGGISVPAGEELLVFPPYPRLFHDKPFYTIESKDHIERRRLPWPEAVKISDLHSITADEHSITIAAKAGSDEMALYHFKRDRFELPEIVKIGNPLKIYDFPVASNLVFAGGKYWIAWMRGDKNEMKAEAILSSWRPGDRKATDVILDGPGNWNSDLSIGVGEESLCVAYHCTDYFKHSGQSKIYTFFRSIK